MTSETPRVNRSKCDALRGLIGHSTRARRLVAAFIVGITVAFGSLAELPSASGSPSLTGAGSTTTKPIVTFGIQPASSKGPDGRGYFDLGSTPGGQYTDRIAVTNYADQPITLTLHPTDAVNTPEGDFALLPPNAASVHFAPWIKIPAQNLTLNLPPRATVVLPFQLEVPKTATPGDHIGGITATLQSFVISPSGQRVQLLQSVGTRIFVRVSGPLHPAFTIERLTPHYKATLNPVGSGRVTLTYVVHNTGNVALGGQQTVSVSGLFGSKSTAKKVPRVQLLLPGFSVGETVAFPGVFPEFVMTGHVSISPLVIPGSQQPPSGPYRGTVHFWAVPWTLVLIVVVVLGLLAWLMLRRRRRRRPGPATGEPGPGGPSLGQEKPATEVDSDPPEPSESRKPSVPAGAGSLQWELEPERAPTEGSAAGSVVPDRGEAS